MIKEERLVLAPLWTRASAFLIDVAIFIAIMYLLGFIATPIANALWGLQAIEDQIRQWQLEYGIAVLQGGEYVYASSIASSALSAYNEVASVTVTAYSSYMTFLDIIKGLVASIIVLFVPTLYFHQGKTVGKKLMKIHVVTRHGDPVSSLTMTTRVFLGMWALEYVGSIMFQYVTALVTLVLLIMSKQYRSLHDILSGTMVVKDEKAMVELEDVEPIETPITEIVAEEKEIEPKAEHPYKEVDTTKEV